MPKDEMVKLIKELEKQMKEAAKNLEFEKAAVLRDQVIELRRTLALEDTDALFELLAAPGTRRATAAVAQTSNGNPAPRGRRRR